MGLFRRKKPSPQPADTSAAPVAAPAAVPAQAVAEPDLALSRQQLRQAREQSHRLLAELLHVQPAAVLKLEKRTDMYLATLRNHVEAMGGTLEVVARFKDGEVRLNGLADAGGQD